MKKISLIWVLRAVMVIILMTVISGRLLFKKIVKSYIKYLARFRSDFYETSRVGVVTTRST